MVTIESAPYYEWNQESGTTSCNSQLFTKYILRSLNTNTEYDIESGMEYQYNMEKPIPVRKLNTIIIDCIKDHRPIGMKKKNEEMNEEMKEMYKFPNQIWNLGSLVPSCFPFDSITD